MSLINDSEQVIFDYQSEFGCLYIYINEISSFNDSDFQFCSEGIDTLFFLDKDKILNKTKEKTIKGLNIIVGVGHSYSEKYKNEFTYSLKTSLRKKDINIYEMNSEHKVLCKNEKNDKTNYKCLLVIKYDNISKYENIIIYPRPQTRTIEINSYVNFINKEYYDNWETDYLINNIPNINNYNYTNYNEDFIYIPLCQSNKYIYISIESEINDTLELYTNIFNNNEEIPNINQLKIYYIDKSISLNFNSLEKENNILINLVALNGKSDIYWESDKSMKYITDVRENKLILNLISCSYKCNLIINNLFEETDEKELGYIFYIIYEKPRNNIDELFYGKSAKISHDNINLPLMLYSQIPNISSPININLQFYDISDLDSIIKDNIMNIKVSIISTEKFYQIKKNSSSIVLDKSIEGKFDASLFASNIYLSPKEMEKFDVKENPWIFIILSSNLNNQRLDKLIIGSTISQNNNLMYSSERIYHYGQINDEEKIVYKLISYSQYHLMRLEIGLNNDLIGWSVKRTIDEKNYKTNDTDLPFITENWYNGRGLITLYIEKGEDIYLTFFRKNIIKNVYLTNFVFKYINAKHNGDFKNYLIKNDNLIYDEITMTMKAYTINWIEKISKIKYYLKIINEEDYINNELINTIAIKSSPGNITVKGIIDNDMVRFKLKNKINNISYQYEMNIYCHIIENDYNIEYVSYKGITIKFEEPKDYTLIICVIIGMLVIIILIVILISCCIRMRRMSIYKEMIKVYLETETLNNKLKKLDDDVDDDVDDDDEDLLS